MPTKKAPTKLTPSTSTRVTRKAPSPFLDPISTTALELPPLTRTITDGFMLDIEDIGMTRSEVVGDYTIAERLGFAYATMTRGKASYKGIVCDVHKAFELIAFDPIERRVTAKLVQNCATMTLPAADATWIAAAEGRRHEHLVTECPPAPEPERRSRYGYGSYSSSLFG